MRNHWASNDFPISVNKNTEERKKKQSNTHEQKHTVSGHPGCRRFTYKSEVYIQVGGSHLWVRSPWFARDETLEPKRLPSIGSIIQNNAHNQQTAITMIHLGRSWSCGNVALRLLQLHFNESNKFYLVSLVKHPLHQGTNVWSGLHPWAIAVTS